ADRPALWNAVPVDPRFLHARRSRLFRQRRGGRPARYLPARRVHVPRGARHAVPLLPGIPSRREPPARPARRQRVRPRCGRLAKAGSEMKGRTPFFISGDLHAIGEGIMRRTNDFDLSGNPVVSILTGPLGTGDEGWPSAFRGMRPQIPTGLEFEELYPATERHGFILLD